MRFSAFPAITALAFALSACAADTTPPGKIDPAPTLGTVQKSVAAPAIITHAIQGNETATGSFVGASKHETRGHASVFRSNGQWYVSLASDFFHDGAPDPKVAFGADGFRQEAILAPLKSLNGAQVYAVPATLDVGNYNEIWIWCEQFAVPLGVAKLTLT